MANGTMELIQTVTVGSGGAASIDFTSIPATYDDLLIKVSGRTNFAQLNDLYAITFNGSTTSYSSRVISGNGSAASSISGGSTAIDLAQTAGNNATANTFGNTEIYIPNYRLSTNKSVSIDSLGENNATTALATLVAGLWSNTAAINRVTISAAFGTGIVQYSTATLYGITRVPAEAKATGGIITDDNQYWYHTFTSSGVFTPTQNLTCDYLVVAGGGGGGNHHGGGGGAGGLRSTVGTTGGGGSLESALSVTSSTNYTITVGAGGAGAATNSVRGTAGGNSVFSTITSTGGGGGGSRFTENTGGNGGSGGGGGYLGTGGTRTVNQGFNGGNDTTGTINAGGGGGGAGAIGSDSGPLQVGGNGGNGVTISALSTPTFTGVNSAYAGGGGGGGQSSTTQTSIGGIGGGGDGRNNTVGRPAIVNSGGGGGGGGWDGSSYAGGAGGSGVVIIRYAK